MTYNFRWTYTYMNSTWFDVTGDGQRYEIELRRGVCDYERSISNRTDAEWTRDVVPLIGMIHRGGGYPIPQPVVDAFNEWRMADHIANRKQIDAHPEKYGVINWDNDPMFRAPAIVRAAYGVTTPIAGARPGHDFPSYVWHGWRANGGDTLLHHC